MKKISKLINSPKQRLETYCFCSVSYYYYYYYYYSFFPCTMNLSTADLRNYRTEFYETWWTYRYMFLVDPKFFRFVVKGVKAIYLVGSNGVGVTIETYGNIEIMSVEMWIRDTFICRMNAQIWIGENWTVFPILWRHEQVIRLRTSRSTWFHSFIMTVKW